MNRNGLTRVQKWITRNGKPVLTTVLVNPNKKKLSVQKRRLILANKAPLITSVEPLKLTRDNYIGEIKQEYTKLQKLLDLNNGFYCPAIKKKVTKLNKEHEYKKKGVLRPLDDVIKHASYIPFIPYVLKNGISSSSMDRKGEKGDISHEIICRAEIVVNGKKKHIGLSVVVYEKKETCIEKISIFEIEDKYGFIKSLLSNVPLGNCKTAKQSNLKIHKDSMNPQHTNDINNSNALLSNVEYIYL